MKAHRTELNKAKQFAIIPILSLRTVKEMVGEENDA